MTITYTWTFEEFETVPSEDGLSNVVVNMHWRYAAVDSTDGISASMYGTAAVPSVDPENYTPFEQLTKEVAVEWATNVLDVASLQTILQQTIIDTRVPPTVNLPPPFNN